MTQEELYKIESDYINELHNRREAAKNFTGQVAGRHSDMFSGHEMTWMTRGFMEGYVKAKETLYTEEDLKILIGKIRSVLPEHNYNHYSIDYNGIIRSLKQK
jgi:hypothetical protein